MEYTKYMDVLNSCYDNKKECIIYWDNGLIIRSDENTGAFESDNGLDLEDRNYLEYYVCAVKIAEIIQEPTTSYFDDLKKGTYIEISKFNEPSKIEMTDGTILWRKEEES